MARKLIHVVICKHCKRYFEGENEKAADIKLENHICAHRIVTKVYQGFTFMKGRLIDVKA